MKNGRHTSEDLAYLRERGFAETADEIERLQRVEDAAQRVRNRIFSRLNDHLCEMKPDYDDSIVGFNEAWDVVRGVFADEDAEKTSAPASPEKIKYWWSHDRKWFCILIDDGNQQATVSLSVEEAVSLMDEVMRTPDFLEFQKKCQDRALKMLEDARTAP